MDQLREWSLVFPDQKKANDYLRRVTEPIDLNAIASAEEKFRTHMSRLDKELGEHDGDWICGTAFTIADVCVAGIMDRIEYLAKPELYEDFPHVNAWFTKIKTRDSYRKGEHRFEDRMWGPLKPIAEFPYTENAKFRWAYWKNSEPK